MVFPFQRYTEHFVFQLFVIFSNLLFKFAIFLKISVLLNSLYPIVLFVYEQKYYGSTT